MFTVNEPKTSEHFRAVSVPTMSADEVWAVRRPDGVVVKFTTGRIKRLVKPRKFKAGTEQYQLAWRISHNIKSYEDAKAAGHGIDALRQQILDELGKLVALDVRQA